MIPEIVESTSGIRSQTLNLLSPSAARCTLVFIEFSQRCLEFMEDASQNQSCMESDSISHT